jgi:hypothetical protein
MRGFRQKDQAGAAPVGPAGAIDPQAWTAFDALAKHPRFSLKESHAPQWRLDPHGKADDREEVFPPRFLPVVESYAIARFDRAVVLLHRSPPRIIRHVQ